MRTERGGRYLFVPRNGAAAAGADGVPVFHDGLCTATQEYRPELDGLGPALTQGLAHGDAPPVGEGEGRNVPRLPVAVALVGVVIVAGLAGPASTLQHGQPS